MDDGSLPAGFVVDDQPTPDTSLPPSPAKPLRITISPRPLALNGGSPGGTTGGTAPADQPDHPATLPDGFVLDAEPKKMGKGEALVTGLKQGLSANFSDELSGVNAAAGLPQAVSQTVGSAATLPVGLARLAYEHATGQPGEATKAYNDAIAQARQEQQQAQQQHPIMATLGNVGGTLATGLALPAGAAAQGASMAARMGAGALGAGAYGAAYGAGEGEGASDRATRAAIGAGLGLITGGLAPPVLAGTGIASRFVADKAGALLGHPIQAYRAAQNIDQAATQRVVDVLKHDAQNTAGGLGAHDIAGDDQSGQPVMLMDTGNAATRNLARATANKSSAAQSTLETPIQNRFEEQSNRAAEFVKNLIPGGANAIRTQEEIDAAQVAANRPAYKKAYAAGDRPIRSEQLDRLMGAPDVVDAMKTAATKGKSRAIADGFGAFNPGVKITDDGRVIFNRGKNGVPTYPNIQFWDYTYRSLRNAAYSAKGDEKSYLTSLAQQLKKELDHEVPEYGEARAGAAALFGAENALEAGQKFLTMSGSPEKMRGAMNKMGAPERALFAEGYVSALADKVSKIADNREITIDKIFNSVDGRQRTNMALGPERAGQLEAFLRREDMMDLARKAVSGNSTTIRQLMQSKLAMGGTHGAVGAGIGAAADEIFNGELDWKKVLMGGILGGTGVYTSAVNAKLAQSIAEKLISDDPKVWGEVLRVAASNPKVATTIRNGEAFLQKLLGSTSGTHTPMLPAPTGAIPAAADQQQQQ